MHALKSERPRFDSQICRLEAAPIRFWVTSDLTEMTKENENPSIWKWRLYESGMSNSTYFRLCSLNNLYKRAFKTPNPNEPFSTLIYSYLISQDTLLCMELSGGRSRLD